MAEDRGDRGGRKDTCGSVTARSPLIGREEEMSLLMAVLDDTVKGEGGLVIIEGEAGVGKTRLVTELGARVSEAGTGDGTDVWFLTGSCIEGGTPYLPFTNALSATGTQMAEDFRTGIKESYIIHSDGRLIVNRAAVDISSIDDDVISSTLTAIRDFIQHSFRPAEEGSLKELLFGEYQILMEAGDQVYLAVVADPDLAEGLQPQLRRVVKDFERGYGHLLRGWKGELSDELMASGKLLDDLLAGRYLKTPAAAAPGAGDIDTARPFETIARVLSDMSKERPVVLFLDDLQWMDPSSLDLLHYLARLATGEKLMIIGAYRPEDLVDDLAPDQTHVLIKTLRKLNRERLYTIVKLRRLNKEENRRMVENIFPRNSFTYGLPDKIFDGSQGNPLFTEEILQELVESCIIYEKDGEWINNEIEGLGLPSSIRDVVMRRVGRLGDRKEEVLHCAAVAGQEFSYDVLQEALGWEEDEIIEVLDDLVKLRVLKESLGEDRYSFDHEVVREVLYDSMSRLSRRRLHERIAQSILKVHADDPEAHCYDLANHYAHTKDREATVKYNLMAGRKALEAGAVAEAVKYLEVTLANLEPDIGTSDEARKVQLRIFYDLGRCHSILGDRTLALSFFGKAIEEAAAVGNRDLEAWALFNAGTEYNLMNEWGKSMENYNKAIPIFSELVDKKGLGEANRGIGQVFWRQGEMEMAIEHLNISIDIFTNEGMDQSLGSTLVDLGNVLRTKGETDLSLEKYEDGLHILERVGDKLEIARCHNNIATHHQEISLDLEKAVKHYLESLRIAREVDDLRGVGYALSGLGGTYAEMGDLVKAEDYLKESYGIFKRIDEDYMIGITHHNFGRVAMKKGEHEKALEQFKKAIELFKAKNLRFNHAETLIQLGRLYINLDRKGEAEEVLSECLALAEDIGAMDLVTQILELMGKLQ